MEKKKERKLSFIFTERMIGKLQTVSDARECSMSQTVRDLIRNAYDALSDEERKGSETAMDSVG